MKDEPIHFCLGCGIQLKQWKPGDDEFCGAYEQCIPLWELKEAKARIKELEAALERADALVYALARMGEFDPDTRIGSALDKYEEARDKTRKS